MKAVFFERDFSLSAGPALDLTVERLTWAAEGGPELAELSGPFPPGGADFGAADLLRRPLVVYDSSGQAVWWGYAARVELRRGGALLACDLDGLASRVAIRYAARSPQPDWPGQISQTPWVEDARAVARFGRKERLFFLPEAGESQAVQAAQARLASLSQPEARAGRETGPERVRVVCRGWWETVGWTHYACAEGLPGFTRPAAQPTDLGSSAANTRLAQSFQTSSGPWLLGEVQARLRKAGAPADALTLEVCADSGGVPGTLLASVSLAAGSLEGGTGWVRFALPAPLSLAASTPYWLVFSRSGAPSAANFYQFFREECDPTPVGLARVWDGSTWSALAGGAADLNFYTVGLAERGARLSELLGSGLGGQFLAGLLLRASLAGYVLRWRSGENTCLEEIRAILSGGGNQGRRLLARVLANRVVEVFEEPEAVEYQLGADGCILRLDGGLAGAAELPAGRRAWLAVGWLEQSVCIERVIWTPAGGLRLAE